MSVILIRGRVGEANDAAWWKAAAQRSWVCYPFRHGGTGASAVRRGDRRKKEKSMARRG